MHRSATVCLFFEINVAMGPKTLIKPRFLKDSQHERHSAAVCSFCCDSALRGASSSSSRSRKAHHSAAVCSFSPYHVQSRVRNNSVDGGHGFQMVCDRNQIGISSVSVSHRWQLYRYFISRSPISASDLHLISFRLSSASHSYLIGVSSVATVSVLHACLIAIDI